MWFLAIFVGFILSFYLGCWVLYRGIKKIVQRESILHAIALILVTVGLFFLCQLCFSGWYARIK